MRRGSGWLLNIGHRPVRLLVRPVTYTQRPVLRKRKQELAQ